jgi:hypothetical protein
MRLRQQDAAKIEMADCRLQYALFTASLCLVQEIGAGANEPNFGDLLLDAASRN